jgi:hypothetical protein
MNSGTRIILLLLVFFGILAIPLPASLYLTLHPGDTNYREHRKVPPPDIQTLPYTKIPGVFKYYFEKNYFLKDHFVYWNSVIRSHLFPDKKYSNVIKGDAGFYFLNGYEIGDYMQRRHPFSADDIALWTDYLTRIDKKLAAMGIDFQVVLAPNKHDIYPEYLPYWFTRHSDNVSRGDSFLALNQTHLRNPALDLKDVLLSAKTQSDMPLFFHTDTHWNEYGAAYGAKAILASLNISTPLHFTAVDEAQNTGGDLARMQGQKNRIHERYSRVDYEKNASCVDESGLPLKRNELDAIIPKEILCNTANDSPQSLLVFTDSFGLSIAPSLSQGFRESRFLFRQYALDFESIERYQPSTVIYLLVARKLQAIDPKSLLEMTFPHGNSKG